MNAILRNLALLAVAGPLSAQGTTPRFVVLENDNLLEGQIYPHKGSITVRMTDGGEVILPNNDVLELVADRQAAFRVVARRRNLRDADDRLHLAKWCHLNGLPAEAKRQAAAAVAMRLTFTAASQFLASLPAETAAAPAIVPVKAEAPAKPAAVAEVPAVDYNSASFPVFASRVHAILLNTCAACHAQDGVKAFRLVKQTGRPAVSRNLTAALPFVDAADPAKSKLLTMAVTPHGTATVAPLRTRNHPAYLALEEWAMIARGPEGTTEPTSRPETPEPQRPPVLDKEPAATPPGKADFGAARPDEKKPGGPADPFDPATFNKSRAPE